MKTYDILTIGGGPAGITLAKILGGKKKVGIVRPEDHSMVYCAMPYVLENLIPKEKILKRDELITDSGADLIRATVTDVSFKNKNITFNDGSKCKYEKLIIATGATPTIPPIDGKDLKGVYTFKTENDLKLIETVIKEKKIKKAVVIGAGAIGIELAQALNSIVAECHLVEMAGSILPNLINEDFSKDAQEEIKKMGILLHLNDRVTQIKGKDRIEKIVLSEGVDISFDDNEGLVVFATGMRASTNLFNDTELKIGNQGIIVNNKLETNIEDVYAVGDCVQFKSGITHEITLGKLATNAVPMSRVLAHNILGDDRVYDGFFNGAATKVGSLFIGGTGLTEEAAKDKFDIVVGYSELTTTFPIMPGAKLIKVKLIADKKTLQVIGGQIISGSAVTDKIDIITLAIQNKLTVRDLTKFSYSAQPYQSFFPANNPIVACAENIISKIKIEKESQKTDEILC
ncbi:MAG: FAD-dependent pyridine nucleotide-disulfide oxidoreductase [Candidatus Zixiibacteriota bacterium]|nr:MAG: FAD-dependent pyridine nucleotide-disulfide oxidoreductase [candidate division Zixibacteria bacterium]